MSGVRLIEEMPWRRYPRLGKFSRRNVGLGWLMDDVGGQGPE